MHSTYIQNIIVQEHIIVKKLQATRITTLARNKEEDMNV